MHITLLYTIHSNFRSSGGLQIPGVFKCTFSDLTALERLLQCSVSELLANEHKSFERGGGSMPLPSQAGALWLQRVEAHRGE